MERGISVITFFYRQFSQGGQQGKFISCDKFAFVKEALD